VRIGERCFVGTNCVILGGSVLPDFCVLGAKSLLNKALTETHTLYGGVPAREVQKLAPDSAYFHRSQGFVF
jgi:acetyltransferase-like isoleucine patch superfamily enzyme